MFLLTPDKKGVLPKFLIIEFIYTYFYNKLVDIDLHNQKFVKKFKNQKFLIVGHG